MASVNGISRLQNVWVFYSSVCLQVASAPYAPPLTMVIWKRTGHTGKMDVTYNLEAVILVSKQLELKR